MTIPDGATHLSEFYGVVTYWQKLEVPYLNDVSEGWQTSYVWREWGGGAWISTDASFSSRRCTPIQQIEELMK